MPRPDAATIKAFAAGIENAVDGAVGGAY